MGLPEDPCISGPARGELRTSQWALEQLHHPKKHLSYKRLKKTWFSEISIKGDKGREEFNLHRKLRERKSYISIEKLTKCPVTLYPFATLEPESRRVLVVAYPTGTPTRIIAFSEG